MNGKEVVYKVELNRKFAQVQSASGDWVLSFGYTTQEYAFLHYLIKESAIGELTELIRAQYTARMMFRDVKLVKEFYKEVERSMKRVKAKSELDDAITLAEEKVLHEKTAESILELEKLKSNGKK